MSELRIRIEGFQKAIDDELRAVRSDGGDRLSLHERKKLGTDQLGNHYYRFRGDGEVGLPDDSPIEVKVGEAVVSGTLVSTQGFRLFVAMDEKLPETVGQHDTLITDPTFLLEGLRDRLQSMLEPSRTAPFNTELGLKLLDPAPRRAMTNPIPRIVDTGLNSEQSDAIRLAFRRNLSYIWGPPGTGKTHTVANLVSTLLREGLDVLVLAHSNVAIDTVVQRLMTVREIEHLIDRGLIVRSGYPRIGDQKELEKVVGSRIAERRLSIRELRQQVDAEITKIEDRVFSGKATDEERKRLTHLRERRRQVRSRLVDKEKEVIHRARLVATTLSRSAVANVFSERRYDVVIVDEASMAYIPHVFWAACLSRQRLVVVGDFRQLGPVVRSDTATAKRWLEQDLFTVAGLVEAIDRGRSDDRMNPAISRLIDRIYGGRLRDAEGTERDPQGVVQAAPFPGRVVTLVDTSGLSSGCRSIRRGYSRYNPSSAEIAAQYARDARDQGVGEVAIISPFVAQARLVHELLEREGLEDVLSSTVHRFQGSERSIIIIDLTDGFPQRAPSVLLSGAMGSSAMRLINVAITRARHKLIILADMEFFNDRLGRNSTVRQILELITMRSGQHSVTGDPLVEPHSLSMRRAPAEVAAGREHEHFPTVRAEVKESSSELIIRCEGCGGQAGLALSRRGNPYVRCRCRQMRYAEIEDLIAYVAHNDIQCEICARPLMPERKGGSHYLWCVFCRRSRQWRTVLA